MQILRDTKIDFMKYRKFSVGVSLVALALCVSIVFFQSKLNLGIDFAGGTQLTLKFRQQPEIDRLRRLLEDTGVQDAQIQRFGDQQANEVMIKTPTIPGSEEGRRDEITSALNGVFNAGASGRLDLNQGGRDTLADFLLAEDPDQLRVQDENAARAHYTQIAQEIMGVRTESGLLSSWDELDGMESLTLEARAHLEKNGYIGDFAVLGSENVGPQIGSELRRKGILAIISSLIGMLLYIWLRFELRFGIGAVVAVFHDIFITLGLFTLAGLEFNLTTIAAFLTIVGYSVNDSVVVFDRVRENLRRRRGHPLVEVMNLSINQTLSRTILTSGTTLLAAGTLLVYGGDVLRGFAFIMTIGVLIGTYSSIYIASPFALLWERVFGHEARKLRASRAKS